MARQRQNRSRISANAFDMSDLQAGEKKGAVDLVRKHQSRMRKCGVCNGTGRYYPIDEGPLQECQICSGLGLLKIKVYRPKGRPTPHGTKVDQSSRDTSCNHSQIEANDSDPVAG